MFWGKKKKKKEPGAAEMAVMWSRNMVLRVAAPSGPGWQRMEVGRQKGGLVAAIKCVHGAPPDAIALDAYVYELEGERATSAEQLRARDWRAHFEQKMFSEIDALAVRSVEQLARGGFPSEGCEVQVDGRLREPPQPLRLRERHIPVGSKLLVVTAAGRAARLDAFAPVVESWLSHAALGGE